MNKRKLHKGIDCSVSDKNMINNNEFIEESWFSSEFNEAEAQLTPDQIRAGYTKPMTHTERQEFWRTNPLLKKYVNTDDWSKLEESDAE